MQLEGRRAVVTGAGGNLGQAVLRAFLAEGARVVAVGYSEGDLQRVESIAAQHPDRCWAVRADVTTEQGVEDLRRTVAEKLGAVELLVNVVGGFLAGKNLWELELADWEYMMSLNLTSAFLCCRAFVPGMLEAGYGRIVCISSKSAFTLRAGTGAYAIAKAGVAKLTEVLREELKGTGVSAVALAPAVIDSPAARASQPKADPAKWVTADELARTIVYLCTEQGGLVSGGVLPAYGAL